MEGIYSSRKLEKACKRDLNFIWFLQGKKDPSHNTIARWCQYKVVDNIKYSNKFKVI